MSINSRQKGKRGELEMAKILRAYGYSCRRTVQYNGKENDSKADIIGLSGIHAEIKRVEQLNINKAMLQAENDRCDGEMPAVFHRKNNERWKVTMWFDDWIRMYRRANNEEDI